MDNGASSYLRYLDGDENGFVEIVRDYKDGLILYLNSFVRCITVAEELAEDTFVKLGIKKPRFVGKSSFRTWLYAIGRNVAVDYLKEQNRTGTVPIEDYSDMADVQTLEASYFCDERKRAIHRSMEKIKSEYRQVLWLIYFEGFSNKEAAKIMRKTVHGIETLTYRARMALKKELIKEGYDYENL